MGPEEATVRFDELSRASALSLSLSLGNVMLCDVISGDYLGRSFSSVSTRGMG